ncbi:DegT/DnrJ/EryC1/StrS aminotransferase family protein [Parabacteroides sp. Marseille-P3160]|uniref:DegT/DnrJ/EryC1/StrS family aminotransferase n=1 Tax=Parabacteroides sp. Marseille-P3160 TaxID=1917887 RepID=UPI00190ECE85|nr:DegT/DnrJ/EryC1/StrS family aminotransferase [Parabacteroides sp. Marseille-P3160]
MNKISRRQFMTTASAVTLGVVASNNVSAFEKLSSSVNKLAILGGTPVRQNKSWPKWPYVDEKVVASITKTARSGIWCRIDSPNGTVPTFEKEYASLMGAKYCVATGSGTQSLHTCVEALGIGPGDEVITTPYTDMGTISGIISARALPVLADIDRESFQLDPTIVERLITPYTRAIIPVHIMGQPCDLDSILTIAKKHKLYVIEDACQAHLAQYRGKRLGTIGDLGCFSHQSSKTIPCGEGGSILGDDGGLMDQCYTVMNHGTNKKGRSVTIGPKYRMNEFEGAVLLAQLPNAMEQWKRRNENAAYLTSKLKACPGVVPQKLYNGTESGSFYLYTMGYRKEYFNNVDRAVFLKALAAEGISLSSYIPNGLHREPWVDHILGLKVYQEMYSPARLKQYKEELACPVCDKICSEEMLMLWASGPLLGTKKDMDDIVNAIMKVYENRDQLAKVKL